jgi:hypothetical protein
MVISELVDFPHRSPQGHSIGALIPNELAATMLLEVPTNRQMTTYRRLVLFRAIAVIAGRPVNTEVL